MKNMAIRISGKLWSVLGGTPVSGSWGHTDYDARTIVVEPNASDKMKLDTMLHELLHAHLRCLNEEAVAEYATNAAGLLIAQGWRLVKED